MIIRRAAPADAVVLSQMACDMWDHDPQSPADKFIRLIDSEYAACFLAYDEGTPVGFAQCQLRRDYVEGTETSPVGYLEGVWVHPDHHRRGIAGMLLDACEAWARSMHCTEFASDCELDNTESLAFHLAVGFREVSRNIHFSKQL